MPLAVLLPRLGDLTRVHALRGRFLKHLEDLQLEASALAGEEDGEERRQRMAEESMLNQVLQWLSVGTEE